MQDKKMIESTNFFANDFSVSFTLIYVVATIYTVAFIYPSYRNATSPWLQHRAERGRQNGVV